MRPSLLPGLLAAAQRNQHRGADSIRLFEIGRRYLAAAEHPTLALLMAGDKRARGWQVGKTVSFDAFDARAARSESRRGGNECVSRGRSRGSPDTTTKKKK